MSAQSDTSAASRRMLRADAALVVAIAAAPVLLEALLGYVRAGTDLGWFFLPMWRWWWSEVRFLGGWNPFLFGGHPSHADPQVAVLHPLTWLYGLLPELLASQVEGAVVPAVAALGSLLYLRRIGCTRAASIVGALSFALGGAMAAHVPHPSIVRCGMLLPWGLLAIEALEGRALVAALAAVVGGMLLAGQPQVSALCLVLVALYALVLGRPLERRRWVVLASGAALGVVLAAGLLLPAVQLIAASTRSLRAPVFPDPTLALADLVTLVVPFAGGGGAGPLGGPQRSPFACSLIECATYPGQIVWIALLAGVAPVLRDRRGRFWLAVAAFALVAALGIVPTPVGVRGPARILVWWSFAASTAAALALTTLERLARPRLLALASAALAAAIAVVAVATSPGPALGAGLALVLAAGALLLVARGADPRWLAAALALDLVLFDLTLLTGGITPERLAALRAPAARVRALLDDPACRRDALERVLIDEPAMVIPGVNWVAVEQIRTVQGYDPLVLRPLAALLGESDGLEAVGQVSQASLASPDDAALDVLRVGLVLRSRRVPRPLGDTVAAAAGTPGARWERVPGCGDGDLEAYRNDRVRPVAWLVDVAVSARPEEAIAMVRGRHGPLDLATAVLLADAGDAPASASDRSASSPGEVSVAHAAADELRLTVRANRAAWLVTSELAYPGWHATVDGASSPILLANGAFRAVRVPAGAHDVRFVYRPWLALAGMAASALGMLAVLALALGPRRPRAG